VPYGLFIGEVVNFVVIAFVLYLFIVKFLSLVMKAKRPRRRRHEGGNAARRDPRPAEGAGLTPPCNDRLRRNPRPATIF